MLIVPEREIASLMTRDAAFAAVEKVFAAMAAGDAYNFPVVREAIGHEDALYGFKGGFDRSGLTLDDVDVLCALHMKRSMHDLLLAELGLREEQSVYLDDTGHMSGVDSLLGLDRAVRDGRITDGDVVLLLAAGTGYTWAANVVRWGPLT